MNVSLRDSQSPDEMVAAEVWACLGRRRISANKAAQSLGWKQTYLSRRLTGSVSFSVPELYALADLLEVPVRQFFPPLTDSGRQVMNALYWAIPAAA